MEYARSSLTDTRVHVACVYNSSKTWDNWCQNLSIIVGSLVLYCILPTARDQISPLQLEFLHATANPSAWRIVKRHWAPFDTTFTQANLPWKMAQDSWGRLWQFKSILIMILHHLRIAGEVRQAMQLLWTTQSHEKRVTIALSTMEAKLQSVSLYGREKLYVFRKLQPQVGLEINCPARIYVDNKTCLAICSPQQTIPTRKHIDIIRWWVSEKVGDNQLSSSCISSSDNVADLFIEALDKPVFEALQAVLLFSKLNRIFFALFYPENIFPDNEDE